MARKRRSAPKGCEQDLASETLEQQYRAALSHAGSGGAHVTGHLAPGEASPETLESGGIPSAGGVPDLSVASPGAGRDSDQMVANASAAGVPDLLVANPFHSERVKAEVALRRSRPTTLDRDAEQLEVGATGGPMATEVQQDAVLEPDYQAAFPAAVTEEGGPRAARVDAAWDSTPGMGFPAQATTSAGSTDGGFLAGSRAGLEGLKGPEVPEDESLETAAGCWGVDCR